MGPAGPCLEAGHRPLDHPPFLWSPQLNAAPADQIRLLDVQALDVRLSQLSHRSNSLPEHAEIEQLSNDLAQLRDLLVASTTEESDIQKEVFRKQIALAKRVKLPIVIHNREATQDCVDILMEEHAEEVGGIMHSFSASPEIADVVINKLNFYVSLGGPVTFKNAKQPKEVAKHVPMDRLLVETDAPYLSPHPYRGKRNEPERVTLVAQQIADLRDMTYEEVCRQTTENAERLFNLN
ncbi:TatD family hydrolase [Staphylococcus hominis]|uniref:TatD family hydrolase n=1 Tax=Staphylococcus hominis TaxID=1290 RepID=UPI003D069CD2